MFHSKSPDHILSELKTTENGLSDAEAASRLVKYGPNEFGKGKTRNLLDILIAQFKNYILILLMLAAAVAYFIGHTNDAFAIGIVVILNVFFGMLLEYRADKSMEELKKIAGTRTVVMRNGEKRDIDSQALVPGDIIFLSEGMKVPADLRIIEEHALEINEASLTGESMPVKKNADKLASQTPLAERSCMAYAGTYITQGNARAVVVGTGHSTEFGILEHTLSSVVEEETTLQKSLAELGKAITIASFVIVAILFIAGMIFGKWSPGDLLIYSVSVIVAAVPEGMLTILTIVLAIGVKRMAMEKALVRKIQSVETLGNITFIATDKTGTITEGRMALVKLYDGKLKDFADISGTEKLLSSAYLCNGAYITEEGIIGDETDKAFVIAGIAKGVDVNKLRSITPTLKFRPFNSDRKYMAGTYKISDKEITIIKGAPEVILPRCNKFEDETGKLTPISEYKEDAEAALSKFTEAGMRVLAVAYVEGEATDKSNLVFLGLLALHDPIRREVKHTIKICRAAGIR
ncbi:HAD-IC family P-type ATPase, partial [Candidatus Micrarchaeota archaeon]|nr:HAD-IC family P-type ATPase [Candidatus Micrarchaeota archaeon]